MKTFRSGDEEVFLRIGRVRLVDVVGWESSWFSDGVLREKGEGGWVSSSGLMKVLVAWR